jgi:hypothetical protein
MYPVINRSHKTHFAVFLATAIKVFILSLMIAAVPISLYVSVDSKTPGESRSSKVAVTVRETASNRKAYFKVQDGREMAVRYRGDQSLIESLRGGAAQPRALASADFDHNGTPDLVAGYSFRGAGMVTLQRGNPEAFAPTDDSVFERMHQG